MDGIVIRGSRNLFVVRTGREEAMFRIKGKILKSEKNYYNPLAPGDKVEVENGLITGLGKRRNFFARFNQKGQATQILASNVDLVLCVTSLCSPPFRPRFLDRVLLQADIAGIPAAIVCNKYDLADDSSDDVIDIEERLSDFERIGCPVFRISVHTGEGMEELQRFIKGKISVLVGQSGVGKSSLIRVLAPHLDLEIKTGAINEKYDRGNHTTTQPVLLDLDGSTRIIDTPGIRRFVPDFPLSEEDPGGAAGADNLISYMREFSSLAGKCSYGLSCSHKTEPGCKVMEAVDAGVIHEDRYVSFLRIREELSGKHAYND